MKYPRRSSHWMLLLSLFLVSGTAALASGRDHRHAKQKQYKLLDLGTLGGPSSVIFGQTGPLNNFGMVLVECADSAALDPFYTNDNPYFGGDPYVQGALLWAGNHVRALRPLPNGLGSCGQWINDRGVVVGAAANGSIDSATGYPAVNAVRWQNGQAQNLGTLGGEESIAFAINDQGQIAGGSANGIPDHLLDAIGFPGATQVHAFRWERGGLQDLGTLGGADSIGFYINARGEVAGQSLTKPDPATGLSAVSSFVWKDGRMIDVGNLGGTFGGPVAINNRSQVAGFSNTAGDVAEHPFFWDRGVLTDIGTFGGSNGEAVSMNGAGQVVGSADLADGTHHAFVWQRGHKTDLGSLGSDPCSNGKGINSWGLVAGTSTDCQGHILHLFLWSRGGLVNLSALIRPGSDVTVTDLVMINDRGEIAGEGVTADGEPRVILLVPDGDCDDECEQRLVTPGDLPVAVEPSGFPSPSVSARRCSNGTRGLSRRKHLPE